MGGIPQTGKLKTDLLIAAITCNRFIATLGPSWNISLVKNLKSLSLQDGPQSGTIIFIIHPATQPATHPPGAKLFRFTYLSNHLLDLPQLLT